MGSRRQRAAGGDGGAGARAPVGRVQATHCQPLHAAAAAFPAPPEQADAPADATPSTDPSDPAADDEECGFCVFMKAGGCAAAFEAWSACVDAARSDGADFADKCRPPTVALQRCMEANREYYADFMMPEGEDGDGEGGGEGDGAAASAASAPAAAAVEEEAKMLDTVAQGAGHHAGEGRRHGA